MTASLTVSVPDTDPSPPPSPEQAAAFSFLLEHQAAIRDAILADILGEYPGWRGEYAELFGRYPDFEPLPDADTPDDLKPLIGLLAVHVLDVVCGRVAYIGFEFRCAWDEEHGLGVMTHKGRVAAVGGADTSFLEWIAERDANKRKK